MQYGLSSPQQEIEILEIEHGRAVDSLSHLIGLLDQEYQSAINSLSSQDEYGPHYTVNLGLIHSLMNNIETTCSLLGLLQNDAGSQGDRLSIYLMKQQNYISDKGQVAETSLEPEEFIEMHKYATQISLNKSMLKGQLVDQIRVSCSNILTIKLESDHFDQKNQIDDGDLLSLGIFKSLSVLQIRESAITDSSIQVIRDKMPNIKQLDLSGCYMLTDRGIKLLSQCNLVTIRLNSISSLNDKLVVELIKYSNNLNYLEVKDCLNISSEIFLKIHQNYRLHASTLKWLEMSSDYGIDLYINKLSYLTSTNPLGQITDDELKILIGDAPPTYTGIFFENCQQLTKTSLLLILDRCKELKRLGLPHFYNLTDRLVQDMSLALESLFYLDLSSCVNITNNALYYIAHNMDTSYLILEGCRSISDEGLEHILRKDATSTVISSPKKKSALSREKSSSRLQIQNPASQYHSAKKTKPLNLELPNSGMVNGQDGIKLKYLNISGCNKVTDQSIVFLCECSPNLQHLNLSYCDQITDLSVENISRELNNLEYINLNHCEGLTDSSISMLATRLGKKLKALELEWCQISQNCVRLIAENLVNLQVLNLSYCPSVNSEEIQIIARNLPNLYSIKLQSCTKVRQPAFIKLSSVRTLKVICIKECEEATDTFIKLLTTNNRGLEHLDISWCQKISDQSLFAIAKNCFNLKHINLNGCIEITDDGIQWLSATVSHIEYLNLTLCTQLTDQAITEITSKMVYLKSLYLCELELLTDISIATISNLEKLEHLMLMGCVNITNSSLISLMYNLEKLTELNISQCRSVDGKQLKKMCRFLGNIKVLEVSEIQIDDEFLEEIVLYCQKLVSLNLCYCNNITDQAVIRMLERMPRLHRVDIMNTNITESTKSIIIHALNARRIPNVILK